MNWFNRMMGKTAPHGLSGDDDIILGVAPSRRDAFSDLPNFRNFAGRIARGGVGERSAAQEARALISDAFTPSQPVNDRAMFAGRRALLESLIVAIEDQRLHFILYGDRGIGKTSILHVLTDIAEDAGYLVGYISCGDKMAFSDFARRTAQRIPLLFHGDYPPGSEEIEQGLSFAHLLPAGEISVSTFGEMLGKLSNTRVLLLLDEFDRVQTDEFRRSIAELIKNLSDNGAPAQIVIAGVAPDVSELVSQIPSIRRNVLGVLVPNMSDEEVSEMLHKAEARAGLTFNDEARELIGLASLGLPYLVGLVAQHAALLATRRDELLITKADVREAIRQSRADLSGRIASRTLHAISSAADRDQLIDLGKLAHAALRSGGVLSAELVTAGLRESLKTDEHLPSLLEPIEGDPLGRWHFADDGASIYIWLSALSTK